MSLADQILDSLDVPDAAINALWIREADDRLAAYRRGGITAMALSDVIAKYQINAKNT